MKDTANFTVEEVQVDMGVQEFWTVLENNFKLQALGDDEVKVILGDEFYIGVPRCECNENDRAAPLAKV